MKKILALCGSNSLQSINKKLLNYTIKHIPDEVEYFELFVKNIPLYNIDTETSIGIPKDIQILNKKIEQFDYVILATNEHNGTVSAFLKNYLDWLSRENIEFLKDKKVLLLSTSTGRGGAKMALDYLATVLPRFGANITSTFSLSSFGHSFSNEEGIYDESQKKDFEKAIQIFIDNQ